MIIEIYWKFARVRWRLFLSAVSVTRAVYFLVNAKYFASKHLKFDSSYSNYRMRGLRCWHVITRTQLFSFLFPLKPCHANLLNRVDHFLICVKLGNMESLLVKTYLNCSLVFFLLAREKIRCPPSVWTTYWANKHPFLAVHQQDRLSCLCQRIIWSKIWPIVSNVHSFVRYYCYKTNHKLQYLPTLWITKEKYKQYTKGMHKNWKK